MAKKVTYQNKVDNNGKTPNGIVPAADINEIKAAINENADILDGKSFNKISIIPSDVPVAPPVDTTQDQIYVPMVTGLYVNFPTALEPAGVNFNSDEGITEIYGNSVKGFRRVDYGIELVDYIKKENITIEPKADTSLDFSSSVVDGYVISSGIVQTDVARKAIKELSIVGNSSRYMHILGITVGSKNLAFLNNSNTPLAAATVVSSSNFSIQIPAANAYKINLTVRYNPSDDYTNLRLIISDSAELPEEVVTEILGNKIQANSLSIGNSVPTPTLDSEATNKKYVDDTTLALDQTGIIIGQKEVSDKTGTKTFTGSAVTFIINKTVTEPTSFKKLVINATVAGQILFAKYTIVSGTAVRVSFDFINLTLGTNEYELPTVGGLNPGQYFGFSCNTSNLPGRIGFNTIPNEDYGYYQISTNVSTGSPVGTLNTNGYWGVDYEVYENGSFYSDIVALVNQSTTGNSGITYPTPTTSLIQVTQPGSTRNDAASILRLNDGSLISAWGTFLEEVTDHSQAYLKIRKSNDNGLNWYDYSSIQPNTGIGNYIPSLYRKTNGDILMIYLVKLAAVGGIPVSYIAMKTSSDEGLTWSAENSLTSTTNGQYLVIAPHRIFVDGTSLYLPYSLLTSGTGDSASSTYDGKLLKSTNDGVNWADTGATLSEADAIFVECGLYKRLDGLLVYYARTNSGYIRSATSSDGGVTFSAASNLISAPNSMSTIQKLTRNNKWVCVRNNYLSGGQGNASRRNLFLYTSDDGITFNEISAYVYKYDNYYSVFEPIIFEDRLTNGIYVVYTKVASAFFDLTLTHVDMQDLLAPIVIA